MGVQILSSDLNDSKHQMVTSTVLAAAVDVKGAPDQIIVWVGSTALASKNQVEIITALKRCRDAIIEFGMPTPIAEFAIVAVCEPGEVKSAVAVTNSTTDPTFTEAEVFVGYSNPFPTGINSSLYNRINAAIDVLLEGTLKAA